MKRKLRYDMVGGGRNTFKERTVTATGAHF